MSLVHEPDEFRHYEWLPTSKLFVDEQYQRDPSPGWVAEQAKKFDTDLFDPLAVSKRSNGKYATIDGQGRLGLAAEVGMLKVPCIVYTGLSTEGESALFRKFQSARRQLRPIDDYKAALFEQEDWAVGVFEATKAHGFGIAARASTEREQTTIYTAVSTLKEIWTTGPHVLEMALRHIESAWVPGTKQRTDAGVLMGLGSFVLTHGSKYDTQRLDNVLSGTDLAPGLPALTPETIRHRAAIERAKSAGKGISADGMYSRRWAALYVIESAYNESIVKDDLAGKITTGRAGMLRKTKRPYEEKARVTKGKKK